MTQLKIAHITTIDMSLRYLLLNQMKSIQQSGYEVVGISASGPDVPFIKEADICYIPVPITRNFTPLADLVSLWHLYRVFRRERFTIVHTHTPKPSLLGQLAARMAGVPIVVNTLHGFYFHEHMHPGKRRFYIMMEKIAARCSDAILSQNREDIQTAICKSICRPEQIEWLGNGIDVQRFDRGRLDHAVLEQTRYELGLPADLPVIGFVGRLVAEKGIIELLQAAQVVAQHTRQLRFLFITLNDVQKHYELTQMMAREYGIEDLCIFAGTRRDMPELYALMDMFVLPSHREGFPRSPMEASAMGVPCIVTDIRGCRDVVVHGQNGLLVPLKDSQALASAMLDLLKNPEKARQMGATGQRIARERFDEQLVFDKVKATYARLLLEKGIVGTQTKKLEPLL